jgi:ribosomal protein S18 acetylase RimI-like enzyme
VERQNRRVAAPESALRTADKGDVAALVALIQSAYRGESSTEGWTTEAALLGGQRTDREAIAETIASPKTRVIVAVDGAGDLIGCCAVERVDQQRAYFGTFAVRPRLQGAGLGKRLLAEAERVARHDWGCDRLEMQVIAQRTDLIEWYERRGYRRTGEVQAFPYGEERFGLPLRDDLYFVRLGKSLPVGAVAPTGGAGATEFGSTAVVPAPGDSSGPAR